VGRLEAREAELQRSLRWHREQHENWKRAAEEKEGAIGELKRHVEELARGKKWLEEQVTSWKREAAAREESIGKLKAWIGELEEMKRRGDEERERNAGVMAELRARVARLEEEAAYWRQEAVKGGDESERVRG
jgi:chromosome segregation ATPase